MGKNRGQWLCNVGLDAYGVKAAGNIEFIDLPMEDEWIRSGEAMAHLNQQNG